MTTPASLIDEREIRHFHLFCGLGGGAGGFNRGSARVGNMVARFRCIGGIDVDPGAIRDFSNRAGVAGTVLDLFDRDQYRSFHGQEPPAGWRLAGTADIQRAAGWERPHIVFLSAPCKGFSGLLSETRSKTDKYQALNRLTLRGVWLMLEAFAADPPELILFENVPRIATRGRALLDQITALLRAYGYHVAETTHDCGRLGGLAQSRKRFLLVARHAAKVPAFLYEPPKRPLRPVGDVLGRMPLPGDLGAGPMHRVPSLQWQTWIRLAFVEAGSDWRSLNRLRVEDGALADYGIARTTHWRGGVLGVRSWDEPAGTIAGRSTSGNGAFNVADPRIDGHERSVQLGVLPWTKHAPVVTGKMFAGGGVHSVADPRHPGPAKHNNCFRIVRFDTPSAAVTGGTGPTAGGLGIADPRPHNNRRFENIYRVTSWSDPSRTVIGRSQPSDGALCVGDPRGTFAVADPRPGLERGQGDAYASAGHFGVATWTEPAGAVSAAACHDNGRWSVADPRLPDGTDRLVAVIEALDGTWHRPFTTFELAALQSLVEPEEQLELDGLSDAAWRERIGNAVPPDAAKAIADTMGTTLLLAWSGESFMLSAVPIWVRPVAIALAVRGQEGASST